MSNMIDRVEALREVCGAAKIHADSLERDLETSFGNEGFRQARRKYIGEVRAALLTVGTIRFDGEMKLMERVEDLTLEEAVDLQLAVEERIRLLRHRAYQRTEF